MNPESVFEALGGLALMGLSISVAIKHSISDPFINKVVNALSGSVGLWFLFTSISPLFPVITETNVKVISVSTGQMVIEVHAKKVRDCEFVDSNFYVMSTDGELHRAKVQRTDGMQMATVPVGKHHFGTYVLSFDQDIEPSKLEIRTDSICGYWKHVTTVQGPIALDTGGLGRVSSLKPLYREPIKSPLQPKEMLNVLHFPTGNLF